MFVWHIDDVIALGALILLAIAGGVYVLAGLFGRFVADIRKRFKRG